MNIKQLGYFPKLKIVLSKTYHDVLKAIPSNSRPSSSYLNIYSCFVDTVVRKTPTPYTAIDILNDEDRLNNHFKLLVGFIYSELESATFSNKYSITSYFKGLFKQIAIDYDMTLHDIKVSSLALSDDIEFCVDLYKKVNKKEKLLKYYEGWTCYSKEGKIVRLHLANFHDTYGPAFTKEIHSALYNYGRKHKATSLNTTKNRLLKLLNEFTLHCNTVEKLRISLNEKNSVMFMLQILNTLIAKTIIKNESVKSLLEQWSGATIPAFTDCFIDAGVFEEPTSPFVAPSYKTQSNDRNKSMSLGSKMPIAQEARLFSAIPLEIKDEKTLGKITDRVNKNIEHIRVISEQWVQNINDRHARNEQYRKTGIIKQIGTATFKTEIFPIGMNHVENTVATFYSYGHKYSRTDYVTFLGSNGKSALLIKELNLPTTNTLMAFLALLVLEHPKITPAWLAGWELFDKYGNMVGLKQVGNKWVAVSFKNRKGAHLAQQEVYLNVHSKFIVDSLITHTKFARESLKEAGNNHWRYMILCADLTGAKKYANLNTSLHNALFFKKSLITNSYDKEGQAILGKEDAEQLASSVTLRNIRQTKGLQIYLKTHSIKAVAEELGHKEVDFRLLQSYLPQALMDFFNVRWVRIFQNAIIFETLKDSPLLVDALDFTEDKLEEFLHNHRLRKLPYYLGKAKHSIENEENQQEISRLDKLVFLVTTPLLQLLIAMVKMVESAKKNERFLPIVEKWYESAVFILNHFTISGKAITKTGTSVAGMQHLYDDATNNPLDVTQLRERFLWR